eukprot:359845-Chlamydomonas_euryale.AAC.3
MGGTRCAQVGTRVKGGGRQRVGGVVGREVLGARVGKQVGRQVGEGERPSVARKVGGGLRRQRRLPQVYR